MNLDVSALPTPAVIALGGLVAVQFALLVIALVVVLRSPREQIVLGQKWPWVLIILCISLVGPILFLAVGRRAAPIDDTQHARSRDEDLTRTVESLYGEDQA